MHSSERGPHRGFLKDWHPETEQFIDQNPHLTTPEQTVDGIKVLYNTEPAPHPVYIMAGILAFTLCALVVMGTFVLVGRHFGWW